MSVVAGLAAALAVLAALTRVSLPARRPLSRARTAPDVPERFDLVEFHAQLAALVRAGLEPAEAVRQVAATGREQTAGLAGSLPGLGVVDAGTGGPGLDLRFAPLAATLALVHTTGAPAAPTLARLAQAAAQEDEARLAVRSALAAPRATARVLTALPLIGLGLGQAMGADPVQVLLGTGPGRLAAVVGVMCAVLGVVWTRHLVRRATTLR